MRAKNCSLEYLCACRIGLEIPVGFVETIKQFCVDLKKLKNGMRV